MQLLSSPILNTHHMFDTAKNQPFDFIFFQRGFKKKSSYRKFSVITHTLEADGNDIRFIDTGRYIPKIFIEKPFLHCRVS